MRHVHNIPRRTSILRSRQGSTFIIVIGILSVLVLIATALSFSTRMDIISSHNYAEGVQSRFAALSGIRRALALLNDEPRYTGLNQKWAIWGNRHILTPMPEHASPQAVSTGRQSRELSGMEGTTDLANLWIHDECSKININTVSEKALARSLNALFMHQGVAQQISGDSIARAIVSRRFGDDQQPGKAGVDDNWPPAASSTLSSNIDKDFDGIIDDAYKGIDDITEFVADIRKKPYGDDTPWRLLSELQALPVVDDTIFKAIAPYLTPLSLSEEAYFVDTSTYPKLNINHASLDEMYEALKRCFPNTHDLLLQQIVVNIADFRDPDSIPTVFPGSDVTYPVIGNELNLRITEIYSDSVTDTRDGDDGQFVEIYNPSPNAIKVDGWQLITDTSTTVLYGTVAPGGFLIVTDDYNEASDSEPEDDMAGYGSFYDIFNVVPVGTRKVLLEERFFDIPDDAGVVYLKDKDGNLVDYQVYRNGTYIGVNRSFQRDDIDVRYARLMQPTPFALNEREPEDTPRLTLKERQSLWNKPFATPADIMFLSSGFYDHVEDRGYSSREPSINETNNREKIDSRIVDLFTIEPIVKPRLTTDYIKELYPASSDEEIEHIRKTMKDSQNTTVVGRININTASYYALLTLPDMPEDLARRIVDSRYSAFNSFDRTSSDLSELLSLTPYKTPSDLLRHTEIWDDSYTEIERILLFRRWINHICTNSRSFSVVSESMPIRPEETRQRLHPVSIFVMLTLDRQKSPVVYFRYLNR